MKKLIARPLKATAIAPANIAFIKYWGAINQDLTLAVNNSISMNLDSCLTKTTIEFSPEFKEDSIYVKFYNTPQEKLFGFQRERVVKHLNRLRNIAKVSLFANVFSENSFPSDAGIAASASAMAVLTMAATEALGIRVSRKQLSILTRLAGSGSACRSVFDGFVEWVAGETSSTSYARQIIDEKHWKVCDIVAVVDVGKKEASSLQGHLRAWSSPYYKARLKELPERLARVRKAILKKDFFSLGQATEEDAVSLHVIAMTSRPPIFYWNKGTMAIMQNLRQWREEGLFGFFTMDAGANVHVICQEKDKDIVETKLKALPEVLFTIVNRPAKGARLLKVESKDRY